MEQKRKRRYYSQGEKVWVKDLKKSGVIKELDIRPKENVYKATVEVTEEKGKTIIKTVRDYDLWELDKFKKEKQFIVPVKYFDKSIDKIEVIEIGDWIDLRSRVDVEIKAFESYLIPLNIAMKLPNGYEAHVLPRSSTFKKWGIILANSMGVIDNSYQGNDDEWLFNAIALRDTVIKKGDRVAQFKIVQKMDKNKFKFKEVEELLGENRGGFGSTGSN